MSHTPAWIEALVEIVGDCIEPHSMVGPLGFYYGDDEELWAITIYPCLIELVGVGADAEVVSPTFSMDLKALWSAFDEIVEIHWNAHPLGPHDQNGAYVAVEGRYQGHEVWLRVLAEAPEDEEPAMQIDPSTTVTEDPATKH